MNLSGGAAEIVIPVLVLHHLGLGQDVVGLMFGLMGAAGVVSAFVSGRLSTEGREKTMILTPGIFFGLATALLLLPIGLSAIVLYMVISGLANGPMDIAMFTLRQRKTDPAWMGRAFTVSMNLNFSGFPIGAAIAGAMLSIWPVEAVIVFAVAANVAGYVLGWFMLPNPDEEGERTTAGESPASAEPA
jgi:predicted MFS family arabinose efflux permease